MDAEKTTAEDVKRVMEAYQRDNFPAGRWASAMFDTGIVGQPETLVFTAPPCPRHSSAEGDVRSPSERARNASVGTA
jgi:hypothetical protein